MSAVSVGNSCGLDFKPRSNVFRNTSSSLLRRESVSRGEGILSEHGALVVATGKHTGRAADDKFIVRDRTTEDVIWWENNQSMSFHHYDMLRRRMFEHFSRKQGRLFVFDGYASALSLHRLKVRVITETAWHSLFVRNMLFVDDDIGTSGLMESFHPDFTIFHAPACKAHPEKDGTKSETFIVINFRAREVLIGGTAYAGEIKKAVFTIMNKILPEKGVLSMHCSANYGTDKSDAAIFFGLSGTGKTTLSADSTRTLIGDDEHGWSGDEEGASEKGGVFNIEAGCYAKVIKLSSTGEPEIFGITRRSGTILENVVIDGTTRQIDLNDSSITENTRACYPVHFIPNMDKDGRCGHPKDIIILAADAFGVLPPISRLSVEQALYYYLSGYTAKVAGTEIGVTEPAAIFSACLGAPFLPLHPCVYAGILERLIRKHKPNVWLVNTGWTGGPYGVGERMEIAYTRRMIHAALAGELSGTPMKTEPFFGLSVPSHIRDIPPEILIPRKTWSDASAYDERARELAGRFQKNFKRFEGYTLFSEVKYAGPRTV